MNLSKMNKKLPAGSILSHYRIVSKIGEGGATELIDGQTLREHLSQKDPLSLNTILRIGVEAAG